MAGRTRATRGKPTDGEPTEDQTAVATAATAVMSLSDDKGVIGEPKLEDAEGIEEDAEAEQEDDDELDQSAIPDDMAIDEQLAGVSSAQAANLMVPDISSSFAPVPSAAPNPEDMLPNVDVSGMTGQNTKDNNALAILLPALRSESISLKNLLAESPSQGPAWGQASNVIRTAFDIIKGPFSTPGEVLLNWNQCQFSIDDRENAWIAMSLANLATILDALHQHQEGDDDLKVLLSMMDNAFPFSFAHTTTLSYDWLDENDYIGVALDIRTQRWMLELDGLDKTDVVNVFKSVFLNPPQDESTIDWDGDRSKLTEANWKDVGDFSMNEITNDANDLELRNKILARVDTVFAFATTQTDPEGQLTKFHEVTPFVQELIQFVSKIFDEVDRAFVAKNRHKLQPGPDDSFASVGGSQAYSEIGNRNLYDGLSSLSRFSRLGNSEFARSRKRRAVNESQGGEGDIAIRKVPQKRQRRSMVTPSQQLAQIQATQAAQMASQGASASVVNANPSMIAPTSPGGSTINSQTDASGRRKELQKRHFWDVNDTNLLCDYIDRYGCNWARISKEATFGHYRTQQQLRDKARNLKVDMLRHDRVLLPGFDNVGLHLKEQTLVRKHNKNPHRKEKDVDENGIPINTEWVEGMQDEYEMHPNNSVVMTQGQHVAPLTAGTVSQQQLDTAAVTDPSLGAAAANMAAMSNSMANAELAAVVGEHHAMQQQLTANLQQSPEEIKQRVQARFDMIHQAGPMGYVQGPQGGVPEDGTGQDADMSGAGMHVPGTASDVLM